MKKLFLTLPFLAATGFANAQDIMVSKKGTPILPEARDWSIGFDVVPIISSFGNLFHASTGTPIYSQVPYTLVGLYVKNPTLAYRAVLKIGINSKTIDNNVKDDAGTATASNPFPMVIDEQKESTMRIGVGFGIQKSRGKGRLRGIYGAEVGVVFGNGKKTYTYGNDISAINNTPSSTDWNSPDTTGGFLSANPTFRITENKGRSVFGVGVDGFLGAEYFFAPKMSISAEYGWGLTIESVGETSFTYEYWDAANNVAQSVLTKPTVGKSSEVNLDVINSTSLVLHLYF